MLSIRIRNRLRSMYSRLRKLRQYMIDCAEENIYRLDEGAKEYWAHRHEISGYILALRDTNILSQEQAYRLECSTSIGCVVRPDFFEYKYDWSIPK